MDIYLSPNMEKAFEIIKNQQGNGILHIFFHRFPC